MQYPEQIPTLAARLARDPRLGARVAHFYERLRALPRAQRRLFGRRARITLAAAALLLALSRAPAVAPAWAAPAVTITVDNGEVDVVDNDLCSLIEAINNANDTADGMGNPPGHDDCEAGDPAGADVIALPSGGSFSVDTSIDDYYGYTALPPITSAITVAGNGSTITRAGENEMRFFTIITGGDATLDDLTLTNGKNPYYTGGAVYAIYGKLTVTNCTISGNQAGSGGGVAGYQADISITDSTLTDNTSFTGGAIYAYYGTLTISATTLSGNQAVDGTGGGLYAINGSATIDNVTADGNSSDSGAGIMIRYAEATIRNSIITGNQASEFGGGGGLYFIDATVSVTGTEVGSNQAAHGAGIFILGGEVDVTGGTISGNEASVEGGGVNALEATVTFDGVTIGDNTAVANGGGLFQELGAAAVTNSTLSGNQAGAGGGIHSTGAMTLTNVTVSDNTADTSGGGTFTQDGTLTLQRSLVAGNSAATGREAHRAGGTVAADDYNLFGFDGDAGLSGFTAGATDVVPGVAAAAVLGPLGDNGGPTQTQALVAGSPAIDAAPSADCSAAPVEGVDQRGQPRNLDGDGAPSADECDIGAFEAAGGGEPVGFTVSVPVILR